MRRALSGGLRVVEAAMLLVDESDFTESRMPMWAKLIRTPVAGGLGPPTCFVSDRVQFTLRCRRSFGPHRS